MLDLTRVTGFDWDEGNARKSLDKHGVTRQEAEEIFANVPLLLAHDVQHSQSEARFQALGRSFAGRQLHVTFTLRSESTKIRVISARDMSRKERTIYAQEA